MDVVFAEMHLYMALALAHSIEQKWLPAQECSKEVIGLTFFSTYTLGLFISAYTLSLSHIIAVGSLQYMSLNLCTLFLYTCENGGYASENYSVHFDAEPVIVITNKYRVSPQGKSFIAFIF